MWGKTTQYEYDLAGRVVGTATIGNTVKFARAYEGITYNDGKGTIDSYYHKMIAANGDVLKTTNYTFTYGNASSGQIPDAVYTMVAGGKDFYFQYDGLGRLKKRTLNLNGDNDGVEEYTYKANGAKTSTVVASKRDFTGYLHTYTYNKNGNIKTETVGSNVREYTYDSLNRLKIYSDPVADVIEEYTYDERGNIRTVTTREYGTPESDASTITYTYGNTTYKDRLTNYNGQALSYGTLGNPTKWANGKSMTWQYGRNLITVGDNITYAYNADGLRISKSGVRNTEYYIVGGKYIGEVTTIGSNDYKIAYVYDETDSVIGINVNGNPYYFAKNLQGDVLAILNYQGSVVARYTYDVWGKLIAVKNNDGAAITSNTHVAHLNPFRYRGYMYDKETGFYYVSSRYYDPEVGRWLNADVPETLYVDFENHAQYNLFSYCFNSPVFKYDYKGYWTFSINLGFSLFSFGEGNSHTLSLTFTKDYWGMQYTKCTPQNDTLTKNEQLGVDIGVVTGIQYTEKNTFEDLEGETTAIGGDVLLGGDVLFDADKEYMGWQWSGTSGVSAGVHKTITDTNTIFKLPTINLPKLLKKLFYD